MWLRAQISTTMGGGAVAARRQRSPDRRFPVLSAYPEHTTFPHSRSLAAVALVCAALTLGAAAAWAQDAPPELPAVQGVVHCIVSDGSGGWYIGGDFERVGGLERHNLAHVLADHGLSLWNPGSDGPVLAIAVT